MRIYTAKFERIINSIDPTFTTISFEDFKRQTYAVPHQSIPVIIKAPEGLSIKKAFWGFDRKSHDSYEVNSLDLLHDKSYSNIYLTTHAVIPLAYFYDGVWFGEAENNIMWVAALYQKDKEEFSTVMVTQPSSGIVKKHSDFMPAFIDQSSIEEWVDSQISLDFLIKNDIELKVESNPRSI